MSRRKGRSDEQFRPGEKVMIITNRHFFSAFLLCYCSLNMGGSELGMSQITDKHASIRTEKYLVKCEIFLISSPVLPQQESETWWGARDRQPGQTLMNKSVKAIALSYRNEQIVIPVSTSSGLMNPNHVNILSSKMLPRIEITGGDAASGYKAILVFARQNGHYRIVRREVRDSEFPDEIYEVTTYRRDPKTN
jgi:hypothetical protein